jgi:hypothetical protein
MPQSARPSGGLTRAVPESMSHSLTRAAIWTGGFAAAAGAVLGALVSLLCWLPDAGVAGHPLSPVKAGVLGFLAAQHGGLIVDGVPTTLAPLLAVIVVGVLAWRAGSTLADIAAHLGERRRRALVGAGIVQAASYAAACLVLVALSGLGTSSARPAPVTVAAFVLFGCVATTSLTVSRGLWSGMQAHRVAGMRAAAAALAVYLGSGALLVAASLVLHGGRVMELSRQVGGGLSGVPILALGVLCAPNAAVAGTAYLAGPGFAVGSGTAFDAFSSGHGVLPAFPLLGALPSGHGVNVIVLPWMVVTVLGAGVVTARIAARHDDAVRAVAVAAAVLGIAMAVLAWLGGGAVGTGRLNTVGASPWQLGLATAGEVAAVALCYLAVRAVRHHFATRPAPEVEDELVPVAAGEDDAAR